MLPSTGGGTNWPGGSVDPETGIFYQFSFTNVVSLGLVNDPERSDMDFIRGNPAGVAPRDRSLNIRGLPLVKPPWGRISAIDLKTGDIIWQIAHGETPDNVREHPDLQGVTIPRTGRQGRVGTLITKTLVIAGEGGTFTTPSGEVGAMLRAYDKATGEEVGEVYMPASVSRLADDLHARRPAVHRPRRQRRRPPRRAPGVSPAGVGRAPQGGRRQEAGEAGWALKAPTAYPAAIGYWL